MARQVSVGAEVEMKASFEVCFGSVLDAET